MSRDWTAKELELASQAMKKMGHMSYEEFCIALKNGPFAETLLTSPTEQLKPGVVTEEE